MLSRQKIRVNDKFSKFVDRPKKNPQKKIQKIICSKKYQKIKLFKNNVDVKCYQVNDRFSKFVDCPEKKSYKFVLHKFN